MPSPGRSDRWLVPAALAGFTIFFYWKVLFTSRVMFPWDAADFFYPYFSFVHEELRHLRIPFWDPYVMSGYPIVGDPEAQIFYPPNWLFVLLHPFAPLPYRLVEIQIVAHFFLAGLFMYYLAKNIVRSTPGALVAAVLFEFSGAMVAHTQHLASIDSMAWVPLIFLLARRGLLEKNSFFTICAGAVFGIQILTGHVQHSVYVGLLLFLYFAYQACFGPMRGSLWPRWLYSLAIIGGIGGALALVQLLPSSELGSLSVRGYLTRADVTEGYGVRFLWTLFLPNYFGGLNGVPRLVPFEVSFTYVFLTVPGCLLALLGLVETVRRRDFFWLGLILLCVDLSLGRSGGLGILIYHVPFLNLFRNISTFFDLANFALCLMAGAGAAALFSKNMAGFLQRHLPLALTILLLSATGAGLVFRLGERVHGWYAMLAVLALSSIVVTGALRNRLSRPFSLMALFGLMISQLLVYNQNELFNWSLNDPSNYVSRDFAMGRRGLMQFLRADKAEDFRVASIAEYALSTNGWNVWRIPSILGWNPITLRRYDEYIRAFIHSSDFTTPYGGPDHHLDSSMLDLLGVKYLIMADPDLEKTLRLNQSEKFEFILEEGWWRIFRSRDHLSHAWFYPRALVAPDENVAVALMSSRWFQGRRSLIFEKGGLPPEYSKLADPLSVISLNPDGLSAISSGGSAMNPLCSPSIPTIFAWAEGKNDWLRYDVPGPAQPGRYILLTRYTSAVPTAPSLGVEIENGGRTQSSEAVKLGATYDWNCLRSRAADLGVFELGPGTNRVTVTSKIPSDIHIYNFWLVRLPADEPSAAMSPTDFSFGNFQIGPNRVSFDSRQRRDGFVLLNEILYPGWRAELDGRPAPMLRADSIFRAIYAPAGSHHIQMSFHPRYFATGAAISLLTLLALSVYFVISRRSAASA